MWYQQYTTCIIPDGGGDDLDAVYVQIIGGFIQDKEVRGVIADHQATESEPHFFTSTKLFARFVPTCHREEKAIQYDLYFVFRQGTYIEWFCLLKHRQLIADDGIFLIEIDVTERGALQCARSRQ